jgi:Holliday junction resolvase RusA-like endonuclease
VKQKLIIPGKLPGMNEIIDGSKYCVYNNGKKKMYKYTVDKRHFEKKVADLCVIQNLKPVDRVRLKVEFKERRLSRDPDNIQAGIKFILDGLVKANILKDDDFSHVREIQYNFRTNAEHDEIKVEIETMGYQQKDLFG